jgi:hypothetical protein
MLACGTSVNLPSQPSDDSKTISETSAAVETKSAMVQATNVAIQATNQSLLDAQATLQAKPAKSTLTPQILDNATEEPAVPEPENDTDREEAISKLQPAISAGAISESDLSSAEYYLMEDFDESWAQINWYQWWNTGFQPANFVIRVDASWDTASNIANWFSSGCGFVYSEDGVENHYMTFLALDGNVHTYRTLNNQFTEMKGGYYGKVGTPDGEAELLIVVKNQRMTFFVNGRKVVQFDDRNITSGNLGFTLNSGTNKDFGFRCVMSNIDVWILED